MRLHVGSHSNAQVPSLDLDLLERQRTTHPQSDMTEHRPDPSVHNIALTMKKTSTPLLASPIPTKGVTTPDTLPTIAEVSPDDSTEDISRVLFRSTDEEESGLVDFAHLPEEVDRNSIIASDTTVPVSSQTGSSGVDGDTESTTEGGSISTSPFQAETDPVEDVPLGHACHGAFNISPKQLADIFALFDEERKQAFASKSDDSSSPDTVSSGDSDKSTKKQKKTKTLSSSWTGKLPSTEKLAGMLPKFDGARTLWPVKSSGESMAADAKTTVVSNKAKPYDDAPRIGSLEQECATLKQIIRSDSATILRLKTAIDTLRVDAAKNVLYLKQLQSELVKVNREKEMLNERETQHLETIKALKKELDEATASNPKDAHQELEQLQIENELFATQIIDNEVRKPAPESLL